MAARNTCAASRWARWSVKTSSRSAAKTAGPSCPSWCRNKNAGKYSRLHARLRSGYFGRDRLPRFAANFFARRFQPPTPPHPVSPFLAELIGTAILITLGNGVVANVVLQKTKGQNSGWIVITAGWAFAVRVAVYWAAAISGAHLNPAVTIGLAAIGKFAWAQVPAYLAAQMLGAVLGSVFVWLTYLPHWEATPSQGDKLAVFATGPAIRRPLANLISEIIGTAVLVA